jgi:hypothetical protein
VTYLTPRLAIHVLAAVMPLLTRPQPQSMFQTFPNSSRFRTMWGFALLGESLGCKRLHHKNSFHCAFGSQLSGGSGALLNLVVDSPEFLHFSVV